jgi:FAD/FMN-containing dehydrogenase
VTQSAEGAVLINMSRMNQVSVDPSQSLARVEGGTRWRQVLGETDKYGLAPVSGSSPTVGVAGYHLGGGHSPIMGRRYGYAADHVQALEIVTADGELRRVTADSEPDLFWALRGGGKGNFAVITALEFTLFPVKTFYGGGLYFAAHHAEKVLHAWREWVTGLPPEMSSSSAFIRQPPVPGVPEPLRGTLALYVRFSSVGPKGEAERFLAPVRALAPTVLDTITDQPYRGAVSADATEPVSWVARSTALRDFPAEAADALLTLAGPDSGSVLRFVELRALGGALSRRPAVPNAVPGRGARFSLSGSGDGRPGADLVARGQLTTLTAAVAPWAQGEIMPNFLGTDQGTAPGELRAVYGPERYDQLAAIKEWYDPANLFRISYNVSPSANAR